MHRTVIAIIVVSLAPPAARADDATEARSLYQDGAKHYDRKQYDEACALFERSLALDAQPKTRGALAICYEDAGRIASAWRTWRDVAVEAEAAGPAEAQRARRAKQKLERLEPRLTRAVVKAEAGVAVSLDGRALDAAELAGGFILVDPGSHSVAAHADGFADWRGELRVGRDAEGATLTVTVGPLAKVEAPPPTPPVASVPPPLPAARPIARTRTPALRYAGMATAGAGLLALGAGVAFGVSARSAWNDAKALGCDGDGLCPTQAGADRVGRASSRATLSTIFVAGGVGLAAGGTLMWLLSPRRVPVEPQVSVGPGEASLGVRGSF